ncbi:NAD-dependent epimerase/dehydratase family protein [Qipengyuania marisflavi]|uniref:NAD-dependent epimerase/dehydratase family protein n=1 Tax=Qipengyuania marisflavi TaxID=2486356 RepID=UPI001FE4A10D|nr:NAD(P)-dependent oxidoreductase [Qipengyuania marisflavi]
MTVALTGGTGFVGQAVLDAAERHGTAIRALTRRPPDQARKAVDWVSGSLSDPASLGDLVRGLDTVIHVAGLTNTPDTAEFEIANVTGTQNLLDACDRAGVERFVLVSSLSAREPELSQYGASKARAETLVESSRLDWTIVRPPAVYGPRDSDMFELFRAAKYRVVPVPPKGYSSIIHVDDLAELLLALIPAGRLVSGKLFEPSDGNTAGYEHGQLARLIGDAVGNSVVAPHLPAPLLTLGAKLDRMLRGDAARLTADRVGYMTHPDWVARFDRAVPLEIWEPRIGGEEGLKATGEWYRAQGWL